MRLGLPFLTTDDDGEGATRDGDGLLLRLLPFLVITLCLDARRTSTFEMPTILSSKSSSLLSSSLSLLDFALANGRRCARRGRRADGCDSHSSSDDAHDDDDDESSSVSLARRTVSISCLQRRNPFRRPANELKDDIKPFVVVVVVVVVMTGMAVVVVERVESEAAAADWRFASTTLSELIRLRSMSSLALAARNSSAMEAMRAKRMWFSFENLVAFRR